MHKYYHFCYEERVKIQLLAKEGYSLRRIAKALERSPFSISRHQFNFDVCFNVRAQCRSEPGFWSKGGVDQESSLCGVSCCFVVWVLVDVGARRMLVMRALSPNEERRYGSALMMSRERSHAVITVWSHVRRTHHQGTFTKGNMASATRRTRAEQPWDGLVSQPQRGDQTREGERRKPRDELVGE